MNHLWEKRGESPDTIYRWVCKRCGAIVHMGYAKPRKILRVMNPHGRSRPAVTCEEYAILLVQES